MSKTTENYGLTKPEVGEFFSLETWNENMDKIDGELKKREDAQKESDNSLMNPKFTEAKERKNLTSGEKIHLMLGKISRFFSDMKAIAFSGSYNDLVDKPKIPTVLNNQTTTEEGYALDAQQANPNIDGTLAKQVADLNGSLEHINRISTTFRLFANVPLLNGIHVFCVTGSGNPVTDSPYPDVDGWWNVICFGVGGATRMTQITSQAYKRELGYKGKDELWIRSMHDDGWSEWVKL